jgi:hypothetical protein
MDHDVYCCPPMVVSTPPVIAPPPAFPPSLTVGMTPNEAAQYKTELRQMSDGQIQTMINIHQRCYEQSAAMAAQETQRGVRDARLKTAHRCRAQLLLERAEQHRRRMAPMTLTQQAQPVGSRPFWSEPWFLFAGGLAGGFALVTLWKRR